MWTNHELRSIQARALKEKTEYILPAYFDDTAIPGIRPSMGSVDLRVTSPPELAEMIMEKLLEKGPPPLLPGVTTLVSSTVRDERKHKTHKLPALTDSSVLTLLESEVGLRYLAKKIRAAQHSLDQASLSPPIPRNNPGAREWEKAIEAVLKANKVRYRYIWGGKDSAREKRIKKHMANENISKFFVGYFPADENVIAAPNFLIIDHEEVVVIFPFFYGEPDVWLSIKQPQIIAVFSRYFSRLWIDCTKWKSQNKTKGR
jgi:hypothetical protein